MKFLPDGPTIPDELVAAQERGEVIFICGAGVSKSIGLPSFKELVERVYSDLGEDWQAFPAEREVMAPNGRMAGQYDRGLRALERRLIGANQNRSRGMRERLRAAVRRSISVPTDQDYDLGNHAALIDLSHDGAGNNRLVTTNFDTLFERAWPIGKAPSYAGAAMPQPKTAECKGILHLHGRIVDSDLDLEETALVLTSAEFGDAYLRSGWASRYVYDLVRAYVVVLIGYSADDPPMRYLLEVLESDRERYADLRKVYAFAEYKEGNEELETALWRAKGVEPILHPEWGDGFTKLYATLREWQRYAADASSWRREHLSPYFLKSAGDCTPEEITLAIFYLQHGDAAKLITELSPPADWLGIFEQNKLFKDNRVSPGPWIGKCVDNPDMIRACARLSAFSVDTVWHIHRGLEVNAATLSDIRKRAWELILETKRAPSVADIDMSWHSVIGDIRAGTGDYAERRLVCEMVRPRLAVKRPYRFFEEDDKAEEPETLHSLIWTDFERPSNIRVDEILNAWPRDDVKELGLLQMLDRTLNDALEQAASVGFLSAWDRSDHDVRSVATHPQNRDRDGFCPIVRLMAEIWSRLDAANPDLARPLADRWRVSCFILLKRLALFAGNGASISGSVAAETILSLDDFDFWISGASVEIMRLIVGRWTDMPRKLQIQIENRISLGIPRVIYVERTDLSEDELTAVIDNATFKRLTRIEAAGIALSRKSHAVLRHIKRQHPDWKASVGDRDDFHSWSESSSGPVGNIDLLSDTEDTLIVQEANRIELEQRADESDLWRIFCSAEPHRALRGLISEALKGNWSSYNWRLLIWAASEQDDLTFQLSLATALLQMPKEPFQELLGSVTSWLHRKRHLLGQNSEGIEDSVAFFAIWDKCAIYTYGAEAQEGQVDYDDVASRAVNDPGGELVWALIERLSDAKLPKGSGLPVETKARLDLALAAQSFQGLLARYQCVGQLSFLHAIDPEWVRQALLPLFAPTNGEAIYLWASNANDRLGTADLFNALRPSLVEVSTRLGIQDHVVESLVSRLFQVAIWHQLGRGGDYESDPADLRRLLTRAQDPIRTDMSWQLWRLTANEVALDERANQWNTVVKPLFQTFWPLSSGLRTPEISSNLVLMALATREAFPDAVATIADTLVPYTLYGIHHAFRFDNDDNADPLEYPIAFLKLLNILIDPSEFRPPHDLAEILEKIVTAEPALRETSEYRRLLAIARSCDS